jgi:plasmid stability protein
MTMGHHTLTLNIPEPLYNRLKDRAEKSHRSIENETLEVLTATVPPELELSADYQQAIDALELLDDESLWRAASGRLPQKLAEQLETLHVKRQREGLTDAETQTCESLVRQYEKTMLIRAQAAALLHRRGHDVSGLRQSP